MPIICMANNSLPGDVQCKFRNYFYFCFYFDLRIIFVSNMSSHLENIFITNRKVTLLWQTSSKSSPHVDELEPSKEKFILVYTQGRNLRYWHLVLHYYMCTLWIWIISFSYFNYIFCCHNWNRTHQYCIIKYIYSYHFRSNFQFFIIFYTHITLYLVFIYFYHLI